MRDFDVTQSLFSFRRRSTAEPGDSQRFKTDAEIAADISNWTASAFGKIRIYYGNVKIGDIETVAADAPLNISIDGDGSANMPLVLSRNSNPTITLKNGDPITYPINWCFQVRGEDWPTSCSTDPTKIGTLILPASGRATITLGALSGVYSFSDFVRSSTQNGLLQLSLNVPAIQKIQPQAVHSLPVKLTMKPVSSDAGTIFSDLYVALFLFLGAFLSLTSSRCYPTS